MGTKKKLFEEKYITFGSVFFLLSFRKALFYSFWKDNKKNGRIFFPLLSKNPCLFSLSKNLIKKINKLLTKIWLFILVFCRGQSPTSSSFCGGVRRSAFSLFLNEERSIPKDNTGPSKKFFCCNFYLVFFDFKGCLVFSSL